MNFDFLPGELERIAGGSAAITDALLTAAQRIREELAMSSKTKRTKTTTDATVGSTHAQITPTSDLAPTPSRPLRMNRASTSRPSTLWNCAKCTQPSGLN